MVKHCYFALSSRYLLSTQINVNNELSFFLNRFETSSYFIIVKMSAGKPVATSESFTHGYGQGGCNRLLFDSSSYNWKRLHLFLIVSVEQGCQTSTQIESNLPQMEIKVCFQYILAESECLKVLVVLICFI